MERHAVPEPGTGQRGLTTEDLAQPTGPPDEGPQPPSDAPTLPGEATATPTRSAQPEPAEAEGAARGGASDEEAPQLLSGKDADGFRDRWQEIQNRFVDDPRAAVHGADALVAEVMQTLATTFADHKQSLEGQWNRGEQVDTEGLRLALRHYRAFFHRLLAE
ncbi:hypothetical protein [Streptomyces lydicus]|uniref:Uncharacterized protein n=1 Tax=Streptomyces lydicus TaxID=47763 RepID=A0A1D7VP19_9ACTN|nr:hypothetical protein [Streptomyces lydicus]AOP48506.1 hypothetical protein SL103_21750 [Streptomyces lydicus]